MAFHHVTLANGLTVIGESLPSARSASVGFFVNTGSRDEQPGESGLSHFLEHMLFKGTPNRSALDVNLDFDRIGASYNAYTSEERTVYYAAVLPEYLHNAVDILTDILRPSLRQDDFDTEKQVILEEIKMYEDVPGSMAWEHAREKYFRSHPLGQTILGTSASVTALTRDQMQAYFDRRYVAANIVVAVAGQIDWDAFLALIESRTQAWPQATVQRGPRTEASGPGGVHLVSKEGLAQQHLLVMGSCPTAESPLRYAASVLATALGDDSGSRLHWGLVDPGLVESASCGLDLSEGNGLIVTSLSGEPEAAGKNLEITQAILAEVQKNGLTADELTQAKNKIASRVVRASERPMGRMRSIAGSWIFHKEYSDPDVELTRYDAVDAGQIREVLDRYPLTQHTIIGYGPLSQFL